MYEDYEIILSDSERLQVPQRKRYLLERLIENFRECLREDKRFRIGGTRYFWVETIHPGTVREIDEHETEYWLDGLYKMKGYGGYECGGRGCFYEEVAG